MLNSLPVRLLWHSFNWLSRLAIVASATMAVLIALTIIALRYYLLPDIEQYHDRITASLASAIGNTVTIGKIDGDWRGIQPRLNFTDVRVLDEQQQPVLVLPAINSSVSWMSLFSAELRLASLEINRPELLIRRDAQGRFYIGGVALSKQSGEKNLADWLLHQSRMVVRDAHVVWLDERRGAPPLVLQQVNLHIENFFSRHRFALRALPPADLATPLDVRGDFHGVSFADISKWRGQLFTQLDYTDVIAWRSWLDMPGEFSRGRGALRGWMGIEGGKVVQIAADLDLRDVVTKLAEDVPEMVLLDLRGRAAWHEVAGGFEISTRHLAMHLQNGIELRPTDFYFRTGGAGDGKPAGGEIRANQLQLETIADLAKYLPLDAGLRARLDAYAPSGKVSNLYLLWQGTPKKLVSYKIKGRFDNLGLRQVGEMPGFSGLTADVDGSDAGGRLSINARQLMVDAPGMMREPLSFATLTGQAGWQRQRGELSINVDNIAVANDDLAGNLYGSYQTRAGTRGVLDLTAKLTRGDIRRAARYTPLVALHKEGNDWLNGALLAGHTEDLRIRIKGNLSDFPVGGTTRCANASGAGVPPPRFPPQTADCATSGAEADGTKDVIFNIGGHARDAVLEFGKDWPRIENITGEFLIRGNMLEVKSPSATMLGARLQNVSVTMPDMLSDELPLEIRGKAEAASNVFLEFIQQSPVRGYINGFTDDITASGNGHLALFLRIPLLGGKRVQVAGSIRVQDNDIDLGKGVPMLRNTHGALSFTESGMQASGVEAEILGGPASINLQTAEGGAVHATVQGRSDIEALRISEPHPLLDYLHGGAEWDADINVVKRSAQVIVRSGLQGIGSNLPQPFAKHANEVMPLRMGKSAGTGKQDLITVRLGKLFSARLARRDEKGAMVVKRGVINFGDPDKLQATQSLQDTPRKRDGTLRQSSRQASDMPRTGVRLTGSLPVLSIQGWEGLAGSEGGTGPLLPIDTVSLSVEKLTGYGLAIDNLRIDAARRGEGLAAQLSSGMLDGELVWQPHGYENGGKLSARLRNLQWMDEEQAGQPSPATEPVESSAQHKPGQLHPDKLPALEFAIENLQVKGKHIGRLELVGHPDGKDWRMRRLRITNPDGSLMGDGIWHESAQSEVNLMLEISDAGKILARSGYPNTVKGGSGKLTANLSWSGTPDEFNYASLNGSLKLDTNKGRFVKMEPGIGKLLSVLSLQALPKHITLDFNDVFSAGFQFDNINGNASIRNGVIDSQDFHIDGSSAKVTLKGSVDLNNETQNLRVRVLPTIGDSVSLIGAFTAGPAVGIGALILNKVLGNPLDKLVSFEYNVSGTWSDPNVVKVGGVQPQQNNTSE